MIRRLLGANSGHRSATGRSVAVTLAACVALLAGACSEMAKAIVGYLYGGQVS